MLLDPRKDHDHEARYRRVLSKSRQIWALEDGEGIAIVSSEGEKGRIIPRRDISPGGVKIPIDFILVAREREKDKN